MTRAVYRFEGIDDSLDLVPLAGRRALDRAHRKLGLEGWRKLPLTSRRAIVEAGAADVVDATLVERLLAGSETSPAGGRSDPDPAVVPASVSSVVPLSAARWAALRALDRWALESLAARGRIDALRASAAELGLT